MRKKSKNILILIIVLGVLIGAYYYVNNMPSEDDEPNEEKIEISKFDKEKIVKMTLKKKDDTLTLTREGEEWKVDYPHEIKLNNSAIDDIAYSFASLYAERVIDEDTKDLSNYGLEDPQAIAEAELDDGVKKKFYLGDKTPTGDTYYLMAEDDPKVYVVWMNHGEHFTYSLSDIRDKKLPEIDKMDFKYLKIDKKDGRPIEIRMNEDQTEEQASFGLGLWQMTEPYNEPMGVDGDKFQKTLDSIPAFTIKDFIDDDPEDLAKYGLEEPEIEFTFKDSENSLQLHIGKEHDDKTVYCKTPDSNSVYTIEKSKLEFMDLDPFTIVDKFAFIVNIDDVDKIVVEGGGKTYTLTITRTTEKSDKEGEEDEVIETYKLDGKEVEESPFKKAYQSLIGLLVDAENNKEPDGKPEVETTFFLNKGKEREIHVDYVPYDNDFYVVMRGGKAEFVISKQQVSKMLDTLELLKEGKLEE